MKSGEIKQAEIVGVNHMADVAVLKIEGTNYPVLEMADSKNVKPGELVFAVGSPLGLYNSITMGVVSSVARQLVEDNIMVYIQTDAAINPGNSGGPLCDLNGNIIGLNVAIFSTTGGYQGIGFAIPANTVRHALEDLIEGKEVSYGWIGVTIQELSYEMAEYFNMRERKGVIVIDVMGGGPAEKAGIKSGDIIVKYEGADVGSLQSLLKFVGESDIGKKVTIGILRDGKELSFAVTVAKRPSEGTLVGKKSEEVEEGSQVSREWRGITVVNITDEVVNRYGIDKQSGVLIVSIEVGSPAYQAGLVRGLVIKEVDRVAMRSVSDFNSVTQSAVGKVLVRTNRGYVILEESKER
jgi:serine protease Do